MCDLADDKFVNKNDRFEELLTRININLNAFIEGREIKVQRNGVIFETDSDPDGSNPIFSIRPFTEELYEKRQPYPFKYPDDKELLKRFFLGMDIGVEAKCPHD
jgi:hypothetical protein